MLSKHIKVMWKPILLSQMIITSNNNELKKLIIILLTFIFFHVNTGFDCIDWFQSSFGTNERRFLKHIKLIGANALLLLGPLSHTFPVHLLLLLWNNKGFGYCHWLIVFSLFLKIFLGLPGCHLSLPWMTVASFINTKAASVDCYHFFIVSWCHHCNRSNCFLVFDFFPQLPYTTFNCDGHGGCMFHKQFTQLWMPPHIWADATTSRALQLSGAF